MFHSPARRLVGITFAFTLLGGASPAAAAPEVKSASPSRVSLEAGEKASVQLRGSELMQLTGAQVVSGRRPVGGVSAKLESRGASDAARSITLEASASAPAGRYELQVVGPKGPITLKVSLEVVAASKVPTASKTGDAAEKGAATTEPFSRSRTLEAPTTAADAARERREEAMRKAEEARERAETQRQKLLGGEAPAEKKGLPTLESPFMKRKQAREDLKSVAPSQRLERISPEVLKEGKVADRIPIKKRPPSGIGTGGLPTPPDGGGTMGTMNHGALDAGPNDCTTCHAPQFETYPTIWNWLTFVDDPTARFVKLRKPDENGARFKYLDANGNEVQLIEDVDAVFSSSNTNVIALQGSATEDLTHLTQGIQAVGPGTATITGVLRLHYTAAAGGGIQEVPAATHSVSVVQCATEIASFEVVPNPVCPNTNATANVVLDGAACEQSTLYVRLRRSSGNNQVATNLSQEQNTSYIPVGSDDVSYTVENGEHTFNHTVEGTLTARLMTSASPGPPGGQLDIVSTTLGLYESDAAACAGAPPPEEAEPANFSDALYDIFQNPKCTNCHGMSSKNATFSTHVNANRFDASITANTAQADVEAYVGDENSCSGCHTGSAWAPHWHAPPATMDFTGDGAAATCQTSKNLAAAGIVTHLETDALILWAVDRIAGVNQNEWLGHIADWDAGGQVCQ